MSRSPGRVLAALAMLAPTARVGVRRVRRGRRSQPPPVAVTVDGLTVDIPDGPGHVRVDDLVVGRSDVRHDPGTSTIEVWTDVEGTPLDTVVRAIEIAAENRGARRIAWLVAPDTPQAAAAAAAGFERESTWAAPRIAPDTPHELWVRIRLTTPPPAR